MPSIQFTHTRALGRLAAGLLVVLIAQTAIAQSAAVQNALHIAPNAAVQASLRLLGEAADRADFERRVDQLYDLGVNDPRALVEQLLVYSAANADDEKTPALVGRVLKRVDLSRETLAAALAPHLDNADAAIVALVRDWLVGCEDRSAARPPDFSAYRALIEADVRAGREPQQSLVAFMFESDAGLALRTMVRAMGLRDPADIRPILWAGHVVDDLLWRRRFGFVDTAAVDAESMAQVVFMARHGLWWARLYAANVVKQHSELARPGVIEGLRADSHPRVRAAAGGV